MVWRNLVPKNSLLISSAVLLLLAAAPTAKATTDAVDTRVTFVLSDDNFFAGPADASPTFDIGPRNNNNKFFDNLNTIDGTVQRVFDKSGVINQFGGAFICQARF
jgi:hypothetical protein